MERAALEAQWLRLTRETLPSLAAGRGWPVRADHCFQRILLDHAFGGCWYDHVAGRPAYRHIAPDALERAVVLGQAVVAGEADLAGLNRQSLAWRGKADRLARKRHREMPCVLSEVEARAASGTARSPSFDFAQDERRSGGTG